MAELTRMTVNLVPAADEALDVLMDVTGDTKTDAVNRAVKLAALIHTHQATGGAVYFRDATGEMERQHFH